MKPNIEVIASKLQMLERQTLEFHKDNRSDIVKIFEKLEMIHGAMITVNQIQNEIALQRASLENQNHRLAVLETDRQQVVGAKTLIMAACAFIGWVVLCVIEWKR